MKRQQLFQVASLRSICLFCQHRLQQQSNPATAPFFRRDFTVSACFQQQSTPGTSFTEPEFIRSPLRDGKWTPRSEQGDSGYVDDTKEKGAAHDGQPGSRNNGTFNSKTKGHEQPYAEWGHLQRRHPASTQNQEHNRSTSNRAIGPRDDGSVTHRSTQQPSQGSFLIKRQEYDNKTSNTNFVGLKELQRLRPSAQRGDSRSQDSKAFQQWPDRSQDGHVAFQGEYNRVQDGRNRYPSRRDTYTGNRDAFRDDRNNYRDNGDTSKASSDRDQAWRNPFQDPRKGRGGYNWQQAFNTNNRSRSSAQGGREPSEHTGQSRKKKPFGSSTESEPLDGPAFVQGREAQHDSGTDWRMESEMPISRFRGASTYDATPGRRKKAPRQSLEDRRLEKFDFSADDQPSKTPLPGQIEKNRKKERRKELEAAQKALQEKRIELPQFISVQNLATALKVRVEPFMEKLDELGFEDVAQDHVLDFENASLVASEYHYLAEADRSDIEDLKARPPPEDSSLLPPRPPVVTIMGHVDHGKTTLLDYLRKSSVAAQEHGGITQHIGAFSVPLESGKIITFLDTPGHAAFLSMRRRGANVTDIVILVVAADDSVKPQTVEAIKHAKAANVPIIVAINKIDKEDADVQGVKQDLARNEIDVEDFGGDVQAYPVSGKTGEGIDNLIEAMTTQAEIIDMRAETDGLAEGWVLEATTKKSGRAATILVRRGTLHIGDVIVAGTTWARVRTLKNEAGIHVEQATPGMPVEVEGWREQPTAGDEVLEAESEQKAASVVDYRLARVRQTQDAKDVDIINENRKLETERRAREKAEREQGEADAREQEDSLSESPEKTSNASESQVPAKTELYFILKADVSGSAEAIEGSLSALPVSNHPVALKVLRTGVGAISEFDIDQASTVSSGNGFIVSFNQQIPNHISATAEFRGIRIIDGNVIYRVIDEIRSIVESKLPPVIKKRVTGEAEVAQVFDINLGRKKTVKVAGCKIRNGTVGKGRKARVYRGDVSEGGELAYDGTINTLKSHKKDVDIMRKGTECGIGFEDWDDMQPGDIVQCYEEDKETRRLT